MLGGLKRTTVALRRTDGLPGGRGQGDPGDFPKLHCEPYRTVPGVRADTSGGSDEDLSSLVPGPRCEA